MNPAASGKHEGALCWLVAIGSLTVTVCTRNALDDLEPTHRHSCTMTSTLALRAHALASVWNDCVPHRVAGLLIDCRYMRRRFVLPWGPSADLGIAPQLHVSKGITLGPLI
jgi:hypothetical protein